MPMYRGLEWGYLLHRHISIISKKKRNRWKSFDSHLINSYSDVMLFIFLSPQSNHYFYQFKNYAITPECNCSIGNIKSQFLPQTTLPLSIVKRLNLRGSRYLLYCGCGWRRIKSPTSTNCVVLSLNVRLTVRFPAFSAFTIYSFSIVPPPYNFLF